MNTGRGTEKAGRQTTVCLIKKPSGKEKILMHIETKTSVKQHMCNTLFPGVSTRLKS